MKNVTLILDRSKQPKDTLKKPDLPKDDQRAPSSPNEQPPALDHPPGSLGSLPTEVQSIILSKLPVKDLVKMREASQKTKELADEVMSDKEIEIIIEKAKVDFFEALPFFKNNPFALAKAVCMTESEPPEGSSEVFENLLDTFIDEFLHKGFIEDCEPELTDRLLRIVCKYEPWAAVGDRGDLYLSHPNNETFLFYLQSAYQLEGEVGYNQSIFRGNVEEWLDRIQSCFAKEKEPFEAQKLTLEFLSVHFRINEIIKDEKNIFMTWGVNENYGGNKIIIFCSKIHERMPEITKEQLVDFMKEIEPRHPSWKNMVKFVPSTYEVWKNDPNLH